MIPRFLALPLTNYVTWSKGFNYSNLQFPYVLVRVLHRNSINRMCIYLYLYYQSIYRERFKKLPHVIVEVQVQNLQGRPATREELQF